MTSDKPQNLKFLHAQFHGELEKESTTEADTKNSF